MPSDRLATVLAAGQRRLAATGAPPGPAQREVTGSPDLMMAVLTAINAGDTKEACRLAIRWCASHKGACADDARWGQLREFVFPDTAGTNPPYPEYIKSNKQWFRMLCQGLQPATWLVDAARARFEAREQQYVEEQARVLEIYERTGQLPMSRFTFGRPEARTKYDIAKLKLKVILWDRWRKGLKYSKPNPSSFGAELSRSYWVALTEEEMRAQLDALEEEDDDGADGPMHGDSGRR